MQKLSEAYETDAGGVKRLRRGSVSVMEVCTARFSVAAWSCSVTHP